MSDTHVNAFRQEALDRLADVSQAVVDAQAALDALLGKLDSELEPQAPNQEEKPAEVKTEKSKPSFSKK